METLSKGSEISNDVIATTFNQFILEKKHPCVMAKTVFMMSNYHLHSYSDMHSDSALLNLLNDLENYINNYDFESPDFESFIAVFPNNHFNSEQSFEDALWNTLMKLYNLDDCTWDPDVSNDPNSPNFSFSLKGKAFYIVGLHPESSRLARQSPYTALVFNLHWQFERLREMGTYKKIKKRIRKRDKKLQGSINPVLKDYGKDTETKQYSGRHVESHWKCPFNPNN
ncbi:guanitoxin biosynthesis heme-dependent pre-guanitoxin N-hydroxylase GntA [Bizionia sp. KMM 8389]